MGGILFLMLVGPYFAFCVWLSKRLTKKIPNKPTRIIVATSTVVSLSLLPATDGIWGYYSLQSLCAEESRTEVFDKVPVKASLIGKDGKPAQLDKYGNVDWNSIRPYVVVDATENNVDKGWAKIRRATWSLVRVSDGKEIARQTNFYYGGSWFLRTNGHGVGAGSCIAKPAVSSLLPQILIPKQ
jgi:hypothetical protein